MSDWKNVPDDISQYHGFIYLITNKYNGMKYVGKKSFFKTVNVPKPKTTKTKYEVERLAKYNNDLKTAKTNRINPHRVSNKEKVIKQKIIDFKVKIKERIINKTHTKTKKITESDWRNYWGSSPNLLADVEKLGENNFTREIILLCKTKWEWSYSEVKTIIEHKALFDTTYYNGVMQCKVPKAPKKLRF